MVPAPVTVSRKPGHTEMFQAVDSWKAFSYLTVRPTFTLFPPLTHTSTPDDLVRRQY
jgi:hypothetical protein